MSNKKYSVDLNNKEYIKFNVKIDGDEWSNSLKNAKKSIAKTIKVDGFRPGSKAQAEKVNSLIRDEDVWYEAINKIANNKILEIVKSDDFKNIENEINNEPANLEIKSVSNDAAEVIFSFRKLPEVTLGDYKKMDIKVPKIEVTNDDIKKSIENLLNKDAVLIEKKEDAIANGDVVIFDFKGYIDNKEMENGSGNDFELEIGSNQFIPGFEEQMIGMKKGEQKSINVKFPKDYHAKEIANKDARFDLNIKNIKIKELPKLDDEFVKSLNIDGVSNIKELEKHQKELLTKSKISQLENELRPQIQDKLASITKLSYVDNFSVETEIKELNREYEQISSQMGMKIDDFLKMIKKDKKEFDEETRKRAEQNVLVKYAIIEIAEKENITCTDSDLNEYCENASKMYNMDIEEIKNRVFNQRDVFENVLIFDKTMKWIIDFYSK